MQSAANRLRSYVTVPGGLHHVIRNDVGDFLWDTTDNVVLFHEEPCTNGTCTSKNIHLFLNVEVKTAKAVFVTHKQLID